MSPLREFLSATAEPLVGRSLETTMDANGVVHVSTGVLLAASLPLLGVAALGRKFDLGLENTLLVGIARSFVQLMVLGYVLHPIFLLGMDRSWLVFAYVLFMILITTRESVSRARYTYPYHAPLTFLLFVLSIGSVSSLAFLAIVRPVPLWNPQYVIPICGMLMGNCINGVSLTANNLSTSIMEGGRREIELYLSFGATGWESVGRLVKGAVATGATPVVNGLNVIGLVSIPGMMTGQILGGSSVTEAAHYQILITWLIATCSFLSMIATVFVLYRVAFDAGTHVLRTDRFTEVRKGRGKMGWTAFAGALCGNAFARRRWPWGRKGKLGKGFQSLPNNDGSNDGGIELEIENGTSDVVFENRIRIQTRRLTGGAPNDAQPFFRITKLQFSVPQSQNRPPRAPSSSSLWSLSAKGSGSDPRRPEAGAPRRRVLCKDLDAALGGGEVGIVAGPSGAGKSTLLRVLSGLAPMDGGDVALPGRSLAGRGGDDEDGKGKGNGNGGDDMVRWRTAVRYVTQHKVDLPGTPREFALRVASFHGDVGGVPSGDEMIARTRAYLERWGAERARKGRGAQGRGDQEEDAMTTTTEMTDSESDDDDSDDNGDGDDPFLDKEWKDLSGGESQRTLLAIAMASRPKVLLMDEATSGLDAKTEKLVEESVVDYAKEHGAAVLWVTHSEDIAERLLKQ